MQQCGHMINKRPGPAGANTVHPLLYRAVEVGDFGIFPAKLNGCTCGWDNMSDRICRSNDLLNKRQSKGVGYSHAARTCKYDRKQFLLQNVLSITYHCLKSRNCIRKMAGILFEYNTVLFIKNDHLYCC
ncbi:hypothetical protein SDC9_111084 [bioreactor metagenome]|uniref:Uncharacterized protein n=1 Tax=bioreactor metagenome TaxID=1076179 RepID=A0A645BGI7_9ZZZZ